MPRRRLDGISCPICRKLVLPLDENGCMYDGHDLRPCRHYVGMFMDDVSPVMQPGFEDLERALNLLRTYAEVDDTDRGALAAGLSGVVPDADTLVGSIRYGYLAEEDWLASLPEVRPITNSWDSGALGCNGTSCYVFASVPNQRKLVARLARLCSAVERLLPASAS